MKALGKAVLWLLCVLVLAGCDDSIHVGTEPDEEPVLVERDAAVMPDGQTVSRWRWAHRFADQWKLEDGTPLLDINDMAGPENTAVGGVESFQDLNEAAQEAVRGYYERQGLLYDVQAELEKAYAEYQECAASGEVYYARMVAQDITPSAFNDRIACFLTTVTLPLGGQMIDEMQLGAVFDRETGEPIDKWELFALPPEEAFGCILDAAGIRDTQLRAEMQAAVRAEQIVLFPDYLSVTFPQGTLPSQSVGYHLSAKYTDLKGVIQERAVPRAAA